MIFIIFGLTVYFSGYTVEHFTKRLGTTLLYRAVHGDNADILMDRTFEREYGTASALRIERT